MQSVFDPAALTEFAKHYGFHYELYDPHALVDDILIDMDRGLRGESSSLPMIPSYLTPLTRMPPGKTVIALDAGGTNLRAALVRFDENGKTIAEGMRKAPMPGTRGRVTAPQFFDQIADLAAPLFEEKHDIEGIGFCFSYPTEMTEDSDGILMAFSKEVDAPDVIGKAIGAGLRDALARRGIKAPGKIVLLNDTAATLLSGLAEIPPEGNRRGDDRYGVPGGPVIGFILGTGMNTAYPENNIPKIGFSSETAPQVIVCETGTFFLKNRGILDIEYDNTTKNPGAYTIEKCASGAYLGPLTLHIMKRAVRDGVLVFDRSQDLLDMETLQTKDLNAFMHAPLTAEGPVGELFGPRDLDALRSFVYLTSVITERGGLLAAATVASAVKRINGGRDPFSPVRIAVEGTTYLVYKGMREALESYLHRMLYAEGPRSFVISPVEQASLFGAAVAALSR